MSWSSWSSLQRCASAVSCAGKGLQQQEQLCQISPVQHPNVYTTERDPHMSVQGMFVNSKMLESMLELVLQMSLPCRLQFL